ncbi:hypothetical protein DK853_37135, partial [Klebsiella oxytoca]
MKKTVIASMSMLVLLTLLGGCTHTSQSEEQSNIDFESLDTDTQVVESQDETNVDSREEQDTAVFIDEKLDENLFICAELKMPE